MKTLITLLTLTSVFANASELQRRCVERYSQNILALTSQLIVLENEYAFDGISEIAYETPELTEGWENTKSSTAFGSGFVGAAIGYHLIKKIYARPIVGALGGSFSFGFLGNQAMESLGFDSYRSMSINSQEEAKLAITESEVQKKIALYMNDMQKIFDLSESEKQLINHEIQLIFFELYVEVLKGNTVEFELDILELMGELQIKPELVTKLKERSRNDQYSDAELAKFDETLDGLIKLSMEVLTKLDDERRQVFNRVFITAKRELAQARQLCEL